MVIEKVHGIQATSLSLNDRFTLLAKVVPPRVALMRQQQQQRRRNSVGALIAQSFSYGNRTLVEQVARRLEIQAKRALKQRLGLPQMGLRRFGSESSLPRLRRANSVGSLSQQSVKNRVSWRQNNVHFGPNTLSNTTNATWRGFRKRGGGQRQLRGRFRGRGMGTLNGAGRVTRAHFRAMQQRRVRGANYRRGMRGGARARGRGGVTRDQQQRKHSLTKEELDKQLDQYMAGTKSALDEQLDNYMQNAMEME